MESREWRMKMLDFGVAKSQINAHARLPASVLDAGAMLCKICWPARLQATWQWQ